MRKREYRELTAEAVKGLSNWQLYTLASDDVVLGVFIDGLEYGNADSGEYFTSPVMAFFQALRMCGRKSLKLREAYERNKSRRQGRASSTDVAVGEQGKKKG